MKLPTISLVTCSYQQSVYLEQTIRSVLDQGYPGLEYVIIDGGSQDGSVEIIKRHAAAVRYWVSEPDGGQTEALIKGFRRTSGDILGWLCSDDLLLPGALETVGRFFRDHPQIDAVYGDSIWIDALGNYLRPKNEPGFSRFVMLFDHDYIPQPSMFWRRALYQRVGELDPRFDLAMDADLWERFSQHGRVAHIPIYLSCMRSYPEQKTRARHAQSLAEAALIRSRHPLARYPYLQAGLCRFARLARVLHKLSVWGYHRKPPPELIAALEAYRIEPLADAA